MKDLIKGMKLGELWETIVFLVLSLLVLSAVILGGLAFDGNKINLKDAFLSIQGLLLVIAIVELRSNFLRK